jgi:hypothetical protein
LIDVRYALIATKFRSAASHAPQQKVCYSLISSARQATSAEQYLGDRQVDHQLSSHGLMSAAHQTGAEPEEFYAERAHCRPAGSYA